MEPTSERRRPGAAALALALLVAAVAALSLLLSDGPGDGPAGRPAVVTTSTGPGAPDLTRITPIDPHGPAAPGRALDDQAAAAAAALGPDGVAGEGPAGLVVTRDAAGVAATGGAAATGLRGRVVTRDARPVPGARVSLRGTRPNASGMTVVMRRRNADGETEFTSPGEVLASAVAGEDGRFEVKGLEPGFSYALVARPPEGDEDHLPAQGSAPALKAGLVVDAGDVRLERGARLSGVVLDPAGRPVPDAEVRLGDGPSFGPGPGGGGAVTVRRPVRVAAGPAGGGGPGLPGLAMADGPSTRTDEAGRFTLPRVRPGRHPVTASKPGLRTARLEVEVGEGEQKDRLELRLGAGLALTVQVVDAQGQPLAGASVHVTAGFGADGGAAKETDAQGLARFEGLASSEVSVLATADGHANASMDARLGPGDPGTPRRITLVAGATVRGRLLRDEDGAPVTQAMVLLEPLVHGPGAGVTPAAGRPDAEGRFTLTGVPPGRHRLRVHPQGVAPLTREVQVGPGALDLGDLRLGALATLDVLVVDPDGAPVADATVDAAASTAGGVVVMMGAVAGGGPTGGSGHGRTAPDGRVRLEGLQPGPLTVRATLAPFADGRAEVVGEPGGRAEVTVRLQRPGRVEGRVLGADGPARVSLLRQGSPMPVDGVEADPDGAFAFERVAAGEYTLSAGGPRSPPFTVQEGETARRNVEAAPTATVEGTVTGPGGAPLSGASLVLGWLDMWNRGEVIGAAARATTDALGRFRLEGVRPGPGLGITVTAAGGVRASFRVDVPDAGVVVKRDLRLPADDAGATVTVRAWSVAQGAPAAGAPVALVRDDDGPVTRLEQTTGPDGVARFDGVAPGRWTASASAPGSARVRATLEVAGASVDAPRLDLGPGGALLVEVLGSTQAEARVIVRREGSDDPQDLWFTSVPLGGRARIDGLEVGARYEVRATAGGHQEARLSLACDGADPAPATLRLAPAR
ncbi:MAG: carboxypeptidase-like regulatory domain-containing protein [Planctomycetes bacterium]|nr:carboxypeptidase-like regulatory domain-containing protein [Planctomycetota bacterium]